jgi:hypothetical protein
MRTIQPITKDSPSRSTDLASDGVEEISVASRKVPAGVLTQFATKFSIRPPATHIGRQPRVMNAYLSRRSEAQMLEETRSRAAEFYFNSTCLVRAVSSRRFRKVPFFLRHLWCALAG